MSHEPKESGRSVWRRVTFMLALVVAGEAIFGLPFVVARVFRPTLLDVFQISNLELGTAFSVYGVVAMIAYFPGGPLADRFSARKLMAVALFATACGGGYYAMVPDVMGLKVLFGFWGLSTILLFWAAMIRATRQWGGAARQGEAFGILDGGRGLVAAILGTVTVALFAALLPEDAATASLAVRSDALHKVIWVFAAVTVAAGVLVWFAVPDEDDDAPVTATVRGSLADVWSVLKNPSVWLQSTIIIAAYVGYKGLDDVGLYGRDAFGFDDVQAAELGTIALWVRPFAAIVAGLVGDKIGGPRAIMGCFAVMMLGDFAIAAGLMSPSAPWMLISMVVATGAAVFGLRGLYFAVFEDAAIPPALTGTAAGLVSVVGYTPDVFMGPVMGYLTDTYPGAAGHEYFFGFVGGFAALGLVTTVVFDYRARSRRKREAG
jgi:sugar phosphate permease